MSNRFEKLYSLPSPLYAPSMPVIIVAGALLKDTQTDKVLAQLKFKSISPKEIKAVTVSLLPLDTANQPLGEKETHQILDLAASRDAEFGQKSPLYFSNNTTRASRVIVEKVTFSDNTVWKSTDTPLSDLPAQKTAADMFSDDELEKQYKLEYGERAIYIADTCSDLWRCNCGAINHRDEQSCHSCGSEKDTVLSFDTNQLKSNCNARVEQAEKAALEARIALKKRSKKVCVAIAIVIVALLIIAGLTWAYTTVISPSIGYKRATNAYSAGDYPTAISEYTKLNGFKDSQEMLQKVFAAYADELFDEGEYQTAVNCYRKLAERNIEREQECHYHLMLNAIAEHDWSSAEIQYGYIKGYSDADERSTDIIIGKAEKLIEEKDYLAANELLSSCPSENEKVAALKKDVQYLIAVSYYEGSNGQKRDYAKAADVFSKLLEDKEYGEEAKDFLYLCAIQIYENSITKDKALTYFEKIKDYKKSKMYLEKQSETPKKNDFSQKEPSVPLTTETASEYIPKLSWYVACHIHEDTISINGIQVPGEKYKSMTLFSHIGVYKDGQLVSGPGESEGYKIVCENSAPEVISCTMDGYYAPDYGEYWNTVTGTPRQEGTATVTLYLYQIVSGELILIDTWSWYLTIVQ